MMGGPPSQMRESQQLPLKRPPPSSQPPGFRRGRSEETTIADLDRAMALLFVAPNELGGIVLRGEHGPVRTTVLSWARQLADALERPFRRVPLNVSDERLLGGLCLADTLRTGRPVIADGLLTEADNGFVVVAMAERLEARVTSPLCHALDRGSVRVERDGMGWDASARLALIALDEGIEPDEAVPDALADRLALWMDVSAGAVSPSAELGPGPSQQVLQSGRYRFPSVVMADDAIATLCRAAERLGIVSTRATILACATARANAALCGRKEVGEDDLIVAARLVLGPRGASEVPAPSDSSETIDEDDAEASPNEQPTAESDVQECLPDGDDLSADPLDEVLLAARQAGRVAGLLDSLGRHRPARGRGSKGAGRKGAPDESARRGRPAGTRMGALLPGDRLHVVETLRAAAPWQRLRGGAPSNVKGARRVEVRAEDFRVRRYRQPQETTVIFTVDASGSAAFKRLAEAKGAVEQVLADCYVRRDEVALIAFRGTDALLVLPPTRSLTRARRTLAGMVGGGGTPLAHGIDMARALALDVRRQGRTPIVIVMTDGRANVALSGSANPTEAQDDATTQARRLAREEVPTLFIDTAPRPRARAKQLADALRAAYLPLPYADARTISSRVQKLAQ